MGQSSQFFYPSADGHAAIYAKEYRPSGDVRGVVQIAHGVCEHSGRYEHFARFLAEQGFVVVANDHRGHGKSVGEHGEPGYFHEPNGWMGVVEDMYTLYRRTAARQPGLPYFLLGHSMGSFLTRTFLIHYDVPLRGVLFSGTGHYPAPLLAVGQSYVDGLIRLHGPLHRVQRMLHFSFEHYNRHFSPTQTAFDWISRDRAVVQGWLDDPACNFLPPLALYRDLLWGLQYIVAPHNVRQMDKSLPVLLFSGQEDPVGDRGRGVMRTLQSFANAGFTSLQYRLYPGARHEMLHEQNWREVYADLLAFLNHHCG